MRSFNRQANDLSRSGFVSPSGMHLVIQDNSGGGGHAHKRADHEKFFPTKVRMSVIQVAAGSQYDASLVPDPSAAATDKSSLEK
jgi:hypothetical protein